MIVPLPRTTNIPPTSSSGRSEGRLHPTDRTGIQSMDTFSESSDNSALRHTLSLITFIAVSYVLRNVPHLNGHDVSRKHPDVLS